MATITRGDLRDKQLLDDGIKVLWGEVLENAPRQWSDVAMLVESTMESEGYAWLGAPPRMREFVDERIVRGIGGYSYEIKNKKWEATIGVDRDALEDEKYGQIKLRVSQLAEQAMRHYDELVFGLLAEGFTQKGYDDRPFFDSAHSEGESGSQGNLGFNPLSSASLREAITSMRRVKDDGGQPLNIRPDTLVVPPELEWTAKEILHSGLYPDALPSALGTQKLAANPLQGMLRLVVSPYLPDADDWFLLSCAGAVKPLILQQRVAPELTALESDSEAGFLRDQFLYGVRARHNAGYGLWQLAYGATV